MKADSDGSIPLPRKIQPAALVGLLVLAVQAGGAWWYAYAGISTAEATQRAVVGEAGRPGLETRVTVLERQIADRDAEVLRRLTRIEDSVDAIREGRK